MAGMLLVLCLCVVLAVWLLQGKESPAYAGQKTALAAKVTTSGPVKVEVRATAPPSKPSVGLTCITDTLLKVSTSAYDDMCARLYVKLTIAEDDTFDPVPLSVREIQALHPKTVRFAISLRGIKDQALLFKGIRQHHDWVEKGCALLDVPFQKAFMTNLVEEFIDCVSINMRKEMVMMSIEPDDYTNKLKDIIQPSKMPGVHIIVVGTRKGRYSCPTDYLWRQKESLDLAILLNKKMPQPVSIATTAAVAEFQFASGQGGACQSVKKVTGELQGCHAKSKQKKFMCGSKIYYTESDAAMKAMAIYAKKNGLNCAVADAEAVDMAAKYVERSMTNLNCNSTDTSAHANTADNDNA
ncbi:uncharacterized protein [Dermacentor andersoni]|uniref:uncharacterized protein n=1 Tax=Dermacentor andersoni TaxID=34620 RepID=UPI002417FF3D|nr:uncharacterized protein LOC129384112 [Dermacentor andersoni]